MEKITSAGGDAAGAISALGSSYQQGFAAIMQVVAEQQRRIDALTQRVNRQQPLK